MRLDNLNSDQKEAFRRRDIDFILKVLQEELVHTKNELVSMPLEKIGELRGRAKTLQSIVKLLGE
jgi:hypothetical protein